MRHRVAYLCPLVFIGITVCARPASAQFSNLFTFDLGAGIDYTVPFDLYDEVLVSVGPSQFDPTVPKNYRVHYAEEVGGGIAGHLALEISFSDQYFVTLRSRAGRASSTGRYSGGLAAPESFTRDLTWLGWDVLFGVELNPSSRVRISVFAGPSRTKWNLNTHGRGRDALYITDTGNSEVPESLRWTDVRTHGEGYTAGLRGEFDVWRGLSTFVGFEYRTSRTNHADLEREIRQDLARAMDETPAIRSSGFETTIPAIRFGLQWRLGASGYSDPAPAAIAAVAASRPSPNGNDSAKGPSAEVERALAAADTARAIRVLEEALRIQPENPYVLGTLGSLLVTRASAEEGLSARRNRAEKLLERALELDPGNPRFLMAYGLLLEKRGMTVDTRRVLGRALNAAADRPNDISAAELADIFYRRGHTLEAHVREFERLVSVGMNPPPVRTPACEGLGAFCMNWNRPRMFNGFFADLPLLTDFVADERAAMLKEYRRALELVPHHVRANRALLGALAKRDQWNAYVDEARRWREAAPDNPWSAIMLAAGIYWRALESESFDGDTEARARAAELFEEAIPKLPEADRRIFLDLDRLLPRGSNIAATWDTLTARGRSLYRQTYWRATDPLHITEGSEHETEHYSRVALAEVRFGEPRSGLRGWATARGAILVRYGRPEEIWKLKANDTGIKLRAAAGRWIFWNYDLRQPSFIFEKDLGSLKVNHMLRSASFAMAQELETVQPTTFEPPFRMSGPVPHQIVRFRVPDSMRGDSAADDTFDDAPTRYEIEFYARVPVDSLGISVDDTVTTGLYFFAGSRYVRVGGHDTRGRADDDPRLYRTVVPPGIYQYSLETLAQNGAAARSRGKLLVGTYSRTELRVSDLLIASSVDSRGVPEPRTHHDLRYQALPCLALPESNRIAVVFEIYGLSSGANGLARYGVEVGTGEAPTESWAVEFLRGLRDLFTDPPTGRLAFDRVLDAPDGRTVEWFDITMPEGTPDEVEITVTITDHVAGTSATSRRVLESGACRID